MKLLWENDEMNFPRQRRFVGRGSGDQQMILVTHDVRSAFRQRDAFCVTHADNSRQAF